MITETRYLSLFGMLCILAGSVLFGCQKTEEITLPDLTIAPDSLELFAPGYLSTGLYERDIAISPDGSELIYTLGNHRQSKRCLVSVRRTGSGWTEKSILPFSGKHHDIEPFFTADGQTLYFASTRPMPGTESSDYNIWRVTRGDQGWGEPTALDTMINGPGGEFYPSLSRNGNLYFTATRSDGIGREDIFLCRNVNGVFQKPEVLDSNINSATYEFNAFINLDENVLIFSSYGRSDDLGGGDLYLSRKGADGEWKPAEHLPAPINSQALDYCPFIDEERGVFYFTSERTIEGDAVSVEDFVRDANLPGNGLGDLYRIAVDKLGL